MKLKLKPGEDRIRTVTVETERGMKIIFDHAWKGVTIIGPIPGAGQVFTLTPAEAVEALKLAKKMKGDDDG